MGDYLCVLNPDNAKCFMLPVNASRQWRIFI